jgi:hypothetical protein
MEDLTGKQLGPYRIVAPLGEGGMASVYKAYQPAMDRYVALKILPRHFASDPQFVGRFNQEAKIVAKLQHPHILPVFDFGEAEGYTYLVMPILQSGTLADFLQGDPLSLDQIRTTITQIGDALEYAHSRGLLHRDVKPSNVLVDESGNCLLSDFGLAKIAEGNGNLTESGAIMGTPAYMSPEQGMGEKLDGRSDIYSLGIILYEMAAGRVPYKAETPMAVLFKHIQDPLPLPRSINPELPDAVERVILKALAKNAQDRYQTAGEMSRAIRTAIPESTEPELATVKHKAPAAASLSGKRPKWIWVVGGLALITLSIGALRIIFGGISAGGSEAEATTASPLNGDAALITAAKDMLTDVQTGYASAFDTLPNDFYLDPPESGKLIDGTLWIMSQPNAESKIFWYHKLSDGEAILLRFKYTGDSQKDSAFSLFLVEQDVEWSVAQALYLWGHTQAYVSIKKGPEENDHLLEGNLTLEPDTWYGLMMAINPKAGLQVIIWDLANPARRIRFVDLTEQPDWFNKSWNFGGNTTAGSTDLYIDDLTEIRFSSFK